jgi:hypothetical protein
VNAPLEYVFELVSNPDYKPLLDDVEVVFDRKKVQRVGSRHECLLPNGTLHIEILDHIAKEGKIEFAEKIENLPMLGTATAISILNKINSNSTHVCFEAHYHPRNLYYKVLSTVLRIPTRAQFKKNLVSLKRYAENNAPVKAG